MTVQSSVGLLTAGDLVLYDVRTCTRTKTSDNKSYVSSLTEGRTFRVPGNLDATMAISLYGKTGEYDIPDELETGKTISVQIPSGASVEEYIVGEAAFEIDIESGENLGIALTCSAVNAASYPNVSV